MPIFQVSLIAEVTISVEADSEQEAEDKAIDEVYEMSIEWEVTDVVEEP